MKWKSFLGENLVVTILVAMVVLMLLIRVIYTVKDKTQTKEILKTVIPTVIPTINDSDFEKNYPLWQLLPYTGDGFIVEKYTEPLVLKISLIKGEKATAVEKIVKWMQENKIDPTTHTIVWE